MPKYLIDMPEGWKIGHCEWIITDGNKHFFCPNHKKCWRGGSPIPCPLANAVKAVEMTADNVGAYEVTNEGEQTLHGKPVKLWATEE